MKKTTLGVCLALVAGSSLMTGCATTGGDTIVARESQKIVTPGPDTQDFAAKAEEMVASMLESGVLDKAAKHPAVIVIGRINPTLGYSVDIDLLTKKIRVALSKANKAITDTTGGTLGDPDFTLSGKIIDTYATAGNKKQHTYTFQLSLTDSRGLAVWEEEKEVTKLTTRRGIGG